MPTATFRFGPLSEHECRILCGYFGSERYFVDGSLVQKRWSLWANGSREFRAGGHLLRIEVSVNLKKVDAAAFVDGQLVASNLFADLNERFKRQRRLLNFVTALMIGVAVAFTLRAILGGVGAI
jgi:hypothetical protein